MPEQLSLLPDDTLGPLGPVRRRAGGRAAAPVRAAAPAAAYRLVRRPAPSALRPPLDAVQAEVVAHRAGPLLVLAGPGTGKTTTLVEAVVARIAAGADPESVLVLTFGRKAANELRERITARLGRTTAEPTARTFHSYAFGLLRRAAAQRGDPPPRLLSGPEQDLVIRDLLAGDAAGLGVRWPERLHPALRTRGFADELRDLLLRAAERGVDAVQLDAWGRRHQRDDWRAAAFFMQQYGDVTELREIGAGGGAAYDPAQLIGEAANLLRADPRLLEAERAARAYVFVDEYQDVDPAQERLLGLLCGGGRFLVAVGDPDQSIYAFRGSDPGVIRRFPEMFETAERASAPVLALHTCRRSGPALLAASRRVAARLRGPARHRALVPVDDAPPGDAAVAVLRTATQEAAYVAQWLRRAHLLDGVPWSRMAVLVRSTAQHLGPLRRALVHAGVPVEATGEELALGDQPGVEPLVTLLRCALTPELLTEDTAVALLGSPLGDADALGLRRLRQQLRFVAQLAGDLRPSGVLLVEALQDATELAVVDERVGAPARQVAELLAVACAAAAAPGATAETVLWAVWDASGLAARWQAASADGGVRGAAADRDLDAAVALFEAAARFTDRLPVAGPQLFLDSVLGQTIPADSLAPTAERVETVRILTAHAAKGLQWDVVAVAGVQDGLWPDLRPRGSVLGSEELVDLAARREPDRAAQLSALLDEERRLFYVAVTRARQALLVTAVDGDDGDQPSRFLDELDPRPIGGPGGTDGTDDSDGLVPRPPATVPRSLTLAGLVAELRTVVLDPDAPPVRRRAAAARLAGLAGARVPGAAPADWWGWAPLSDARPLRADGEAVSVSPSRVQAFGECALRWLLEASGGSSPSTAQGIGTLVHEVSAGAEHPVDLTALSARLAERWARLDLSGWYGEKQRQRAERMVAKLADWLAANPRRLVAAERAFTVEVGRAVVKGRVDRLERDGDDRLFVVDLKTGTSKPRSDEIPAHPQLGVYQLAVERGGFDEYGHTSGGASLVHIGAKAARYSEQPQPALAEQDDPGWAERLVRTVAEGMAGSAFAATENDYCRMCPVQSSCPVQSGQVTT